MKKILIIAISIGTLLVTSSFSFTVLAVTNSTYTVSDYQLLVPLPDGGVTQTSVSPTNLVGYVNSMFRLFISLAVVLAVLMIVYGGFLYMSTDAITGKKEGKEIIKRTLWGLLLLLVSFLILNTLNPDILSIGDTFDPIPVPVTGTASTTPTQNSDPQPTVPGFYIKQVRGLIAGNGNIIKYFGPYTTAQECNTELTKNQATYANTPFGPATSLDCTEIQAKQTKWCFVVVVKDAAGNNINDKRCYTDDPNNDIDNPEISCKNLELKYASEGKFIQTHCFGSN